jgi:hypothetical protein
LDIVEVEDLIQKALEELDLALKAYIKKDFEEVNKRVWNTSSEVEYLLFMLRMQTKTEGKKSPSPPQNKNQNLDMVEYIVKAQELLQESLQLCKEKQIEKVYEKVFSARSYLVTLQEKIETKKL